MGTKLSFIEQLNFYIRSAFDNEDAFLKEFCDENDYGLLECYMATNRVRIVIQSYSGGVVTTTIPTREFIAWVEGL